MIYAKLLLLAAVIVYIVDISGFTLSWRSAVAKYLHKSEAQLKPLPPFDCGKCATFWGCLLYALFAGKLTLGTMGFATLLSLLSIPLGQSMILIREGLNKAISLLQEKLF